MINVTDFFKYQCECVPTTWDFIEALICPFFSRKNDCKKEKSLVSFTGELNIICSQTQLDDIAHEQTIIFRQLFADHMIGFRPMKREKNLYRMIIKII